MFNKNKNQDKSEGIKTSEKKLKPQEESMGNVDFKKVVIAGASGIIAMTALMFMAPMMGMPDMNMGHMLGPGNPMMPMPVFMGWVIHLVIGLVFTYVYAAFLIDKLPSTGWKRGMIFGLVPWVMMQVAAMPMMGMGFFSGGDMMTIIGTLMAHLVFGGVMGFVYGDPGDAVEAAAPAPAPEQPEEPPVPSE